MYTVCRDVGRGRLVLLIPSVVINGKRSGLVTFDLGRYNPARAPRRDPYLPARACPSHSGSLADSRHPELDGLSSSSSSSSGSSSPARPSPVSSSARSATAFLLSTYRVKSPPPLPDDPELHPARDSTVTAALRCQRWSERLDRAISKPDDRVLDCCLFFRSREGVRSVTLWTADRNLALLVSAGCPGCRTKVSCESPSLR